MNTNLRTPTAFFTHHGGSIRPPCSFVLKT
jgi:hypothetical protein